MIAPGARFELRFAIPPFGDVLLDQLKAVVWTAIHLGAVGRRARRGYGSLEWLPGRQGDLLADFVPEGFQPKRDLADPNALAQYLRRGLTRALGVFEVATPNNPRSSASWFQLRTIAQVFVGTDHRATYDSTKRGMEYLIHGIGPYDERSPNANEPEQLGKARKRDRLASPMLWHVYRLTTREYVPVMTWSPRSGITRLTGTSRMRDYLTGTLGFGDSLAGDALAEPLDIRWP